MRIGSLFSGAGGLDMAVEAVFGGEVIWHSEIDKAASKVLAYRFPAPNLGSITEIDWATVEPVDVLCGGFPCQDVSAAGKRAGIKDGTRSGLWAIFADAIDALRPRYVVVENVRGLLSATAHRAVESDDAVVGDGSDRPVLRALGAVLGDLSDLGYDAKWATVAAASVGAPHRRERVFIVATDAAVGGWDARQSESEGQRRQSVTGPSSDFTATDAASQRQLIAKDSSGAQARESLSAINQCGDEPGVALLPTPSACNANDGEGTETWLARREVVKARVKNGNGMGMPLAIAVQLLPTPTAQDGANNGGPSQFQRNTLPLNAEVTLLPTPEAKNSHAGPDYARMNREGSGGHDLVTAISLLPTPAAQDGNGGGRYSSEGHQTTLPGEVRLLPTPNTFDGGGSTLHPDRRKEINPKHSPELSELARHSLDQWGKYAPAIARWEQIVGPAPAPTEPNKNGNPRLSAAFSEWLMGWPAGWVTDPDIGISRNDQLRIVGNGVCTQQAIAALRYLLAVTE